MKNITWHFILLLLNLIISNYCFGQHQNAVWCFGDSVQLKFDSTISITQNSGPNSMECSSSISDKQGNLLFYAGGVDQGSNKGRIWNSSHLLMQNGDSIALNASSTNGVIIIPFPNDTNKFYVISNTFLNPLYSMYYLLYNIIDISQNNGLGKVISKNQYLTTDSVTEKLELVRHGNGKDWWLIYHAISGDIFYVSLIDSSGIHLPQQYHIGTSYDFYFTPSLICNGSYGQLIASQSGDKLVAVSTGIIDLFDFDRCSGIISNYQNLLFGPRFTNDNCFYGASFSSSGQYLFISNWDQALTYTSKLLQFDLDSANIVGSQKIIFSLFNSLYSLGQHRIAPDNKIYIARCKAVSPSTQYDSVNTYLSVINVPDSAGQACEFDLNSLYLNGGKTYLGLPNMPNYNLGRLIGSACDTITSITEMNDVNSGINIFPNPSNGKFEIVLQNQNINSVTLNIYSVDGKLLKQQQRNFLNTKATIDVSEFSNGVYFLEVKTGYGNFVVRKKLMIEK